MCSSLLEFEYRSSHPLRTFWRLFDTSPWRILLIQLCVAAKASPAYLAPVYLAEVVRSLTADTGFDLTRFVWISAGFGALLMVNPPLTALAAWLMSKRTRLMERRLRSAVVQRFQQLSIAYHGETPSGSLHAKVLRDVQAVVLMCVQLMHMMFDTFFGLVLCLIIVGSNDYRVMAFFILTAPPAAMLIRRFSRVMRARNRVLRCSMEGMSARVGEMINLIPVTRAHGVEDHEIAVMESHLAEVHQAANRVDMINAWFTACCWVTMQLFGFGLIIGSALLVWHGYMSIDKLLLYHGLYWLTISNLQSLLNLTPVLTQGYEGITSIGEVLECPDIERNRGGLVLDQVTGTVRFEQVGFRYEPGARPAIEDFSLDVQAGECIAFVGESGSGKSTLMNLLIGFWRPDSGRILLDGVDQAELDLRSWRRHVAVVPQQTVLFSGSMRENISYGLEQIDEAAIQAAVVAANLQQVVADLPDGLDTLLGENGIKLSGGQRQRVAIARAIVRNPRIIILDEATSALDVESEREVQVAIEQLICNRTTFIVAHRLSTIRRADRVVVMAQGRCVEHGSREDLLRDRDSRFARMEALQRIGA